MSSFSPKTLKPRLFANSAGDLFLEITIRNKLISRLLPPMQTPEEAQNYIDKLCVDMAKAEYRRLRNRSKRRNK